MSIIHLRYLIHHAIVMINIWPYFIVISLSASVVSSTKDMDFVFHLLLCIPTLICYKVYATNFHLLKVIIILKTY